MQTTWDRMGRIRLFPLLFQNGCSQSSRFLPQARRIVGSGDENDGSLDGMRIDVVQSLNSPFFPSHIGAEPGRAKEESRITCMCMLRTNQSKITRSQPRCSRQCVAQCLSQLALWKKTFFWRWYCHKKHKNVIIEIWFIVACTLIDKEYASLLFSQNFFRIVSVCWAILQKFLKGKSDAYK